EIEQRYAKEYIANIHFIFEDYEKAAELYQELIDNTMSDEQFHAYGCCINMANVYLELGTAEKAREAMYTLADNLSRIDADAVSEVEASMDDVLANIAIAEGNLPEAKEYLEKAEAYYKKNSNNAAFLGGAYYTLLTRCKYMVAEGNLKEVQLILEKNIEEGDAAYYGLEKEFYSLLEKVYQQTGQNEKLAQTYKKLLEMNKEFRITTQREYLEFSGYYKENNQLKDYNVQLNRTKTIAVFSSIIITAVLILLLIFVRLLRRKNVTDQLTGIYNRKKLNQLARTYKRTGTPEKFGVVMMDIDYFKRYNDAYGHPEGDEVLKKVSRVLVGCVRSKDFVIRYGGEEFLVLLNGLTQQNAEDVCRRIHNKLNETAIPHGFSDAADHVTLSMGLCYQEKAKSNSIENLIDLADQCLYSSKKNGRNRVTSQRCD
ncbi:MAG: diguanylate cyclase, partial [Firmicutes bacterium]|nr:diguanylate cyclase [Bacillota bacterium]